MSSVLEIRDLCVEYRARDGASVVGLDAVELDVAGGEVVGLLGESGGGKSTLLLAILGLLPPSAVVTRGSVRWRGRELLGSPLETLQPLRGAEIAIVFQDPALALNPVRRVGPQVAEVLRAHRDWASGRCRDEAVATLGEVGFAEPGRIYEAYPHELSGGQRQRVVLAQALACRPSLILADEPTASLDSTAQAELRGLLGRLRERLGVAILIASHDLGALNALADRVAVMYAGRIVEIGPTAQVFGAPAEPYTRGLVQAFPRVAYAARP